MARKPTIDVEKAMQMLREGQTTQAVARHFGVSRQAIDLHRRKLIAAGQLTEKRAARSASRRSADTGAATSGTRTVPKAAPHVPLDELIEMAIEAFQSLRKLPSLESELSTLRQENEKALRRIEEFERELSKRREQEYRWETAMTGDAMLPPKAENPPGAPG